MRGSAVNLGLTIIIIIQSLTCNENGNLGLAKILRLIMMIRRVLIVIMMSQSDHRDDGNHDGGVQWQLLTSPILILGRRATSFLYSWLTASPWLNITSQPGPAWILKRIMMIQSKWWLTPTPKSSLRRISLKAVPSSLVSSGIWRSTSAK